MLPSKIKELLVALLLLLPSPSLARIPLIPPPEYDYPYDGVVHVEVVDRDNIQRECGGPPNIAGCAWVDNDICYVIIAGKTLRASVEDILRHEIAHCNGWEH